MLRKRVASVALKVKRSVLFCVMVNVQVLVPVTQLLADPPVSGAMDSDPGVKLRSGALADTRT
jgi:hypothetical protein